MKAIASFFVVALALTGGVAHAHSASFGDSGTISSEGAYAAQVHASAVGQLSRLSVEGSAAAVIVARGGEPDDGGHTMLAEGGSPDDSDRTMLADGGEETRTQLA